MKLDWLISTSVAVLMLGVSPSFAASNSTKVCDLLTREELMAAGVAITAQGLMPDAPVSLLEF